jgi:hypothetical protein
MNTGGSRSQLSSGGVAVDHRGAPHQGSGEAAELYTSEKRVADSKFPSLLKPKSRLTSEQ